MISHTRKEKKRSPPEPSTMQPAAGKELWNTRFRHAHLVGVGLERVSYVCNKPEETSHKSRVTRALRRTQSWAQGLPHLVGVDLERVRLRVQVLPPPRNRVVAVRGQPPDLICDHPRRVWRAGGSPCAKECVPVCVLPKDRYITEQDFSEPTSRKVAMSYKAQESRVSRVASHEGSPWQALLDTSAGFGCSAPEGPGCARV